MRDTARQTAAHAHAAAMEGGCLAWSVSPDGSFVRRLAGDLDALLATWAAAAAPHPEEAT